MKVNGTTLSSGEGKRSAAASAADPEVSAKATRRRFTAAYKLSIVEKADACETPGETGELLRREGLYSSHLSSWRKAAREGSLRGLAKKRGPRPSGGKREAKRVRKLERGQHAAARGAPQGAHHHRCPGKSCGAAGREPRGREALLSAARGLAGHVGDARQDRATGRRRTREQGDRRAPRHAPACREQVAKALLPRTTRGNRGPVARRSPAGLFPLGWSLK